jgi:hypothetical protein
MVVTNAIQLPDYHLLGDFLHAGLQRHSKLFFLRTLQTILSCSEKETRIH